jgi:hypothetical protein
MNNEMKSGANVLTTKKSNRTTEKSNYMIKILNETKRLPRLTKAKGVVLAFLITGAVALPILLPVQKVRGENENSECSRDSSALLGTWLVHVPINPNTVPPGAPLDFTELDTFDAGGGFLASNNGPGSGDPAGQGNWVRIGERQFALTQLRLGFDADNHFTEINKIRSRLTLNKSRDEFTVSSQVDIILPNGTVLPFHPAATSHGTRVAIEPLN